MPSERIQKLMSKAGLGSRRENETVIVAGRVTVNGVKARLGDKADPAIDDIRVDGKLLQFDQLVYIKLNKPKGVISSTEDEMASGRTTVRDLVDLPGFLYPIGRLDKQSEGLMVMTNDGQLTHLLTHPRYRHPKKYQVVVEGKMSPEALNLWREGLILDGRLTAPAHINVIEIEGEHTEFLITLHEGRKRQIRRIAASLGHPVKKLLRIQIGTLKLGELGTGQWDYLTPKEVAELKALVAE